MSIQRQSQTAYLHSQLVCYALDVKLRGAVQCTVINPGHVLWIIFVKRDTVSVLLICGAQSVVIDAAEILQARPQDLVYVLQSDIITIRIRAQSLAASDDWTPTD